MSTENDMLADLGKKVDEVLQQAVQPADELIEEIDSRIGTIEREKRELLAQRDRVERMKDASKMRKRAGRPARSKRQAAAA